MKKPTIAELEKILSDDRPHEIYMLPNGEIRARRVSFWKYLWCLLTLNHLDPGVTQDGDVWRCKRCKRPVKIV